MSDQYQEGGCQCGAVRFRTPMKPWAAMACHCRTCKLRTGAAYGVGLYFDDEEFEYLQGEVSQFEFHSDTSGRWLRNEFCPKCGTAVSWLLEMRPGLRGVAGGAYDDPDWYKIDAHIWTQSARSDMCYPESAEIFEQGTGR